MGHQQGERSAERHHATQGTPAPAREPQPGATQRAGSAAVERMAQASFTGAGVSGTTTAGRVLHHDSHATVTLPAGCELSAWLDDGGVQFHASPGVHIATAGPGINVTDVRYDFSDARFHATANDIAPVNLGITHFDLAGFFRHYVTTQLEETLDKTFRPLLPAKMAHPGYSIHGDRDLQGTIAQLRATVDRVEHKGGGGRPHAAGGPGVKDLEASAIIDAPSDLRVPLGHGFVGTLRAGTRITLDAKSVGAPPHAVLNEVDLKIDHPGFEVVSTKHGVGAALSTLNLLGAKIKRGGHFEWSYTTGPEDLLEGLALAGEALGGANASSMKVPNVRIQVLHQKIDAVLNRAVSQHLADILRKNDGALPGLSLSSLFDGAPRT